jgi:phosphoglycerate dehydrogenase-like enzyme
MTKAFGTVAIPRHFLHEGLDLDALLPHVPERSFHDERDLPLTWSANHTAVIVDLVRFPAPIIDRFPGLRLMSVAGTGVHDWVDVPHATRRGIAVCNVPGWGSDAIAEFTFALLLAVARKLIQAHEMARGQDWREEEMRGLELRGLSMGLVGLGHTGQRVAEIAESFGLDVLACTRRPQLARQTRARVTLVPLDELLRRSHVLSIHCALTEETRGLIGARELALLPQGAILINTARGAVVDTEALVASLERGHLRGAGLDVFHQEPLPDGHPLTSLKNVILAPHVAGQTDAAKRRLFATSVANVDAFAVDRPTHVVNPQVLHR